MNNPTAAPRSAASPWVPVILLLAALALLAYFFWPRPSVSADSQPGTDQSAIPADAAQPPAGSAAAGTREVGGILLDAEGNRVLNEAGLPISKEPLPQAKPIPIKAAPGEIIGYSKDAQGNAQPIRAGELKSVPNAPGTFAVVDMWADGGPTVVAPTRGNPVSAAELARMRAEEDARDRGPVRP